MTVWIDACVIVACDISTGVTILSIECFRYLETFPTILVFNNRIYQFSKAYVVLFEQKFLSNRE